VAEEELRVPPDILPPDRRGRAVTWGGLLFIGAILAVVTVTSALISSGVFAVIMVVVSLAVFLALWRRPTAHRPSLHHADAAEMGATPERLRDLRR
jgi:hypothetical protein